jgi:hypothetical protein
MNSPYLRVVLVLLVCLAATHAPLFGQPLADRGTSNPAPRDLPSVRFQKRLPAGFTGYAVEIGTSEYPIEPTNSLFRQFGNVHYEKLRQGGYSYLILTEFSDEKSARHFHQSVVLPKVQDALVVEYRKGTRMLR